MEMSADEFEKLVADELDALPDDMVDGIENVAFLIEDRPEDGSLNLLGLYDGIDNTHRGQYGYGEMPDRITLFREPLLSICANEQELRDQVHITLVHEIGHFFGIDDAELHALGWG
ncbi:MAG: metallopeptidase family protein [Microbacteriaceae bacterium]|nr:MAG: metallopeptidase family protein [Microbacteriaceae bacterium]